MTIDEFEECKKLAPGLLSDIEVNSIFNSISKNAENDLGFSKQKRIQLDSQEFSIYKPVNICVSPTATILVKKSEMTIYTIEFEVSSQLLLKEIYFNIIATGIQVEYDILKNGISIQRRRGASIKHSKSIFKTFNKTKLLNIRSILIEPNQRYQFKYKYIYTGSHDTITEYSTQKIQNTEYNIHWKKGIILTVHDNDTHIIGFGICYARD